jgi:hypothetical protein
MGCATAQTLTWQPGGQTAVDRRSGGTLRNRSVVRYLPNGPKSGCHARVDCLERQMILMRGPWPTALCISLRPPWLITMPCITRRPGPVPCPTSLVVKTVQRCAPVLLRPCGIRCPRPRGADIGDRPRGRSATLIVPRASPIGHEVDDHLMQLSSIAQDRWGGSDRLLDADAPGNGRAQQPAAPRQ